MQYDKRRAQSLGKINCLKSLSYGALAFLGRNSRKLITIWRSHHHLDRQRTKIMQTAELDLARIEHFLNSRHQRQTYPVSQFDQIKPKFGFDFTQHFLSSGVPPRVPASGKGDHTRQQRRRTAWAFRRGDLPRVPAANIVAARERARSTRSRRSTPPQWPKQCAYQSGLTIQ